MKSDTKKPDQRELHPDQFQRKDLRRPFSLTITLLVFLLWVVLGWLRFSEAVTQKQLIGEFFSPGNFWYLVVVGLVWGTAGLPVMLGLLLRAGWTLKWIWISGLLYPATYWIERLFLWKDPGAQANWPFMLLLTLIWLGILTWVSRSNRVRKFLRKPLVDKEGH